AYQHQDVPFEKLLQELNPPRDLSRTPYFQVLFNMFNPAWGSPQLGEASMTPLPDPESVSKFDITLYVMEKEECLDIEWVYCTDLFTSETIQTLLSQYHRLLREFVAQPEMRILDCRLDQDNACLPDPSTSSPAAVPPLVPAILARSAFLRPEALAVADTQNRLTYGELNSYANRLANYLLHHGLEKGDVVAIYAHRNAALITSILGALKAGCAFLILDPAHPTLRLGAYLRLARPKALVHISEAGPLSQTLSEVLDHQGCSCRLTYTSLTAGSSDDPLLSWPDSEPDVSYRPEDPASVVFTSGSTGIPKGVLGKLSGLSQAHGWYEKTFDMTPTDRHAMMSGLAHDLIQRDLFTPILFGAAVLIPEAQDIRAPERLIRWMNQQKITVANLTPPMMDLLNQAFNAKSHTAPLSELRMVFTVGALLTKESVQTFLEHAPRVEVVNLYGSTETQRSVGYFPVPRDLTSCPGSIPLGQGIEGVQLLVLNKAGQTAAVGELGEI
ncbi:MAG: AMP-binding protein, partial [Acidobacteriota bacterium]